jgi:RND superfamily putative drug exporter
MERLAGFLARRRWWVVGAWLAILLAALPLASRQTEDLTGGGFSVPGSQSAQVEEALDADYEGARDGAIAIVLEPTGAVDSSQAAAAGERMTEAVDAAPDLSLPPEQPEAAQEVLAAGDIAVVPLQTDLSTDEQTDAATDLREAIDPGTQEDGVTAYLAGQPASWAGLQELSKEDLEKAEAIGFPIVALILLGVFGSLAAASLPLVLGFASVALTGSVIYLLSQQMEMSVFVTNMASMIGIGVAVDYSLFILARFREEVRSGAEAAHARATALATSGLAVAFSGAAVIISLGGLWMVDNQSLRSMALGAMVVVAISILTAVILLPALIRLLGHRVEAGGAIWSLFLFFRRAVFNRRRRPGSSRSDNLGFWERWTRRVMARPWLSVLASSAVLLTLAIPVLSMETGTGALDQFPSDHDVVVGNELANAETGGGANPVSTLVEFDRGSLDDPANQAATEALAADIDADREIAGTEPPAPGEGSALIAATPRHASDSDQASALVERLRNDVVPASEASEVGTVSVGGEAARIVDVRDQISGSMWKIIVFILGFSYLVLMIMLRSVLLPLKAILMNLLSIGAAYGVLVAVFQWGWIDGFLGFESTGAIDTLTPPLILAIVFGLSMDYEVFLLSRIRERYELHGDNTLAVAEGLASSARTISSAALIMTSVFAVFVLTGVPSIKELGLGTAVAIALDATLVRLILVPAAMALMGRWNWWLPGWLDRFLPDVGFEGPAPEDREPADRQTKPAPARA